MTIPTAAQRLTQELAAFAEPSRPVPGGLHDPLPAPGRRRRLHPRLARLLLGPLDAAQRQLQRQLLEAWPPLLERLRLLLAADPSATHKRLDELDEFVTSWLDRPGSFDWTIPATIPEAKQRFHAELGCCFELLGSLGQDTGATIVVPDTNVLVRSPELARYAQVLGITSYTVVLVAPVLAELDLLKTGRSNQAVRERARKVSERIKEWRRRGPLPRGVKVQHQVLVRAEAREPSFQATLSWLDATVTDDRIIAATLELQRRHPTDRLVLLTGDVNLLAKADVAGLPTADTPDPDLGE